MVTLIYKVTHLAEKNSRKWRRNEDISLKRDRYEDVKTPKTLLYLVSNTSLALTRPSLTSGGRDA